MIVIFGLRDVDRMVHVIEGMAERCDPSKMPKSVTDRFGRAIGDWLTTSIFTGRRTPKEQTEYYRKHHVGMYGSGSSGQPRWMINPWEHLDRAGGDAIKRAHGIATGSGFLESLAVEAGEDGNGLLVALTTKAKMRPYPGGELRGTPHYLRNGWDLKGKHMEPRWQDGVVGGMLRWDKPYLHALHMMKVHIFTK